MKAKGSRQEVRGHERSEGGRKKRASKRTLNSHRKQKRESQRLHPLTVTSHNSAFLGQSGINGVLQLSVLQFKLASMSSDCYALRDPPCLSELSAVLQF